jgi:hypothetical protein
VKKADGFVVVDPGHIQEFLDPLPVECLWGMGRQESKVFQRLGIRTISQLAGGPWTQSRVGWARVLNTSVSWPTALTRGPWSPKERQVDFARYDLRAGCRSAAGLAFGLDGAGWLAVASSPASRPDHHPFPDSFGGHKRDPGADRSGTSTASSVLT